MESPLEKSGRPIRHRIEIKVSPEQKELIKQGAALAKQGVSEFVRSAAESAARELMLRKK
jgi:uncharacterized protein (DUF1778 family)